MDFSGCLTNIFGTLFNQLFSAFSKFIRKRTEQLKLRKVWKTENESWHCFNSLFPSLEIITQPWSGNEFDPVDIIIRLRDEYQMPPIIANICDTNKQEWSERGFQNLPKAGISSLSIPRIAEGTTAYGTHNKQINIQAHAYNYFDFLATHRMLTKDAVGKATTEERAFLKALTNDADKESPVKGFPNPLSVGLSVFCHGGSLLALTQRTKTPASGGSWGGGKYFNAVGENMNVDDIDSSVEESRNVLDPWITARRGLEEEMGIFLSSVKHRGIKLHTFAYATNILDYKFFGLIILDESKSVVEQLFLDATDRDESKSLIFIECGNKTKCRAFLCNEVKRINHWTPEGMLCTIRSFQALGMLSLSEMITELGRESS